MPKRLKNIRVGYGDGGPWRLVTYNPADPGSWQVVNTTTGKLVKIGPVGKAGAFLALAIQRVDTLNKQVKL